eukprot:CAMPEP_0194029288 /NCGR_PEP_ID=MMETSP0009_2-20130614/3056_1 /TAXON_ID=210454 /ORGANISM="Grammatophora oceanica, Strain CCMP 410" /LENGTH=260 /DNA_ID=CAMNT_0038668911 /DNA_START=78 /DNA_END=860 /DNA_ORIENTATION=-
MACSSTVFPELVIQSVADRTSQIDGDEPIPRRMQLTPVTKQARLLDCTMTTILIDKNDDSDDEEDENEELYVRDGDVVKVRNVLRRHCEDRLGTIVLVVRRPGCFFCREQALSLSVLIQNEGLDRYFGVVCVVKETGIDDGGLLEFHNKFFPFPLYCDRTYAFYQALGDRKVGIGSAFGPTSIKALLCDVYYRVSNSKNTIGGNFKGEGLIQGGVMFFNRKGKPIYAYREETGKNFPVEDILITANAIKKANSVVSPETE